MNTWQAYPSPPQTVWKGFEGSPVMRQNTLGHERIHETRENFTKRNDPLVDLALAHEMA